jgi:hypothetical protein
LTELGNFLMHFGPPKPSVSIFLGTLMTKMANYFVSLLNNTAMQESLSCQRYGNTEDLLSSMVLYPNQSVMNCEGLMLFWVCQYHDEQCISGVA